MSWFGKVQPINEPVQNMSPFQVKQRQLQDLVKNFYENVDYVKAMLKMRNIDLKKISGSTKNDKMYYLEKEQRIEFTNVEIENITQDLKKRLKELQGHVTTDRFEDMKKALMTITNQREQWLSNIPHINNPESLPGRRRYRDL